MDRLVLKGGNLLDMVYRVSTRASNDLDFSMEGEFASVDELRSKLSTSLHAAYAEIGFEVFDIEVTAEPPKLSEDRKDFWGGYRIYFKLIESVRSYDFRDHEAKRRNAIPTATDKSTRFRIDISKHEFCGDRRRHLLNGYVIYGYSPELFVAEKLRAICQQTTAYSSLLQRHRSGRARDFVDICCVLDQIGLASPRIDFEALVSTVFHCKRVPLELLRTIESDRDFHQQDFVSVQATVKPGLKLRTFDSYFDQAVAFVESLKIVGDV